MSKKQDKKDSGKGKAAEKAPKANGTPEKKEDKGKTQEQPRVTKKSIVIEMLDRKNGSTIEQMGEAMTKAGLGELDRNIKTAKLWLFKIGFAIKRDKETGRYSKA